MTRLFLITAIILPLIYNAAWAQSALRFRAPEGIKEIRLLNHIKKTRQIPDIQYIIAPTDLNNDLINEYIIRPKSNRDCSGSRLCPYYVIALQERTPITLGKFNAHKIVVSSKKTYGVRDIIVYNDHYNDFKTNTVTWHPYEFKYK